MNWGLFQWPENQPTSQTKTQTPFQTFHSLLVATAKSISMSEGASFELEWVTRECTSTSYRRLCFSEMPAYIICSLQGQLTSCLWHLTSLGHTYTKAHFQVSCHSEVVCCMVFPIKKKITLKFAWSHFRQFPPLWRNRLASLSLESQPAWLWIKFVH